MTHTIPEHLLRQRTIRVVVIGCGGNGSVIAMGLPYVHQALVLLGHPGGLEVTLIDGDVVSPSNCVRQPFSHAEIGLSKATVLVSRINLFWGLQWKAIQQNLAKHQGIGDADIVISCVDTRSARAEIQRLVGGNATVTYWLDLGNGSDGGQFVWGNRRTGATHAARHGYEQPLSCFLKSSIRHVAKMMAQVVAPWRRLSASYISDRAYVYDTHAPSTGLRTIGMQKSRMPMSALKPLRSCRGDGDGSGNPQNP